MTRLPNPQLAQQWRQRLDRFAESDLTIAEYCQAEGYSTASFYQWRRKLADNDRPRTPRFVPVKVEASDLPEQYPGSIEVDLPGGARITIPAGSALPDCRNLIQAVVDATAGLSNTSTNEVLS